MAKNKGREATPGFALKITDDTDLGLAVLMVEDEAGRYEPVGCVVSLSEAREIAAADMRRRLYGGDEPGVRPFVYKVWAHGVGGAYCVAGTFPAALFQK